MTLPARWATCALCPRLCRSACPVATGSAREAAVPSFIATVLGQWEAGQASAEAAREVATLCTACGACQDHCHIDRPLPDFLARARVKLLSAPSIEPLQPMQGEGDWVAVEADDRPLAEALSRFLDAPVVRWPTADRFGVAAIEHPVWPQRAHHLREAAGDRALVVVDGGVAQALTGAGVSFQWLHEVVRGLSPGVGSCQVGEGQPMACCGGAGPLSVHHPRDAVRVGQVWLDRADEWRMMDGRCRNHLRE